MAKTLDDLLAYLDRLDGPAPLAELEAELSELDIDLSDLGVHVQYSSRTYRRNLIRGGDWYGLWVLCWRNGQRSPIHDHKGSNCGVRVMDGTATETLFEFAPNGLIKATGSRDLAPGGVIGSRDTGLPQVTNLT